MEHLRMNHPLSSLPSIVLQRCGSMAAMTLPKRGSEAAASQSYPPCILCANEGVPSELAPLPIPLVPIDRCRRRGVLSFGSPEVTRKSCRNVRPCTKRRMGSQKRLAGGAGARAVVVLLVTLLGFGCNKATATSAKPQSSAKAAAPSGLTVGFIYVGPKDDYGYNQAHAEGAKAVAALPSVKMREEENVPETVAVQKTMESMINLDGAKLLFPTSFGYFDPHILKMAEKYPDVTFLHCGGLYNESKHPKNVGSYFGYIDEAEYVSGIVAGLNTKTKKLGFVAAKTISPVLRHIQSFWLGAKTVDPHITTSRIFTRHFVM